MLKLRDQGLSYYDLGNIFADEKGTLYADDIHLVRDAKGDSPGYRMMAREVGKRLAEAWKLQAKP